MAEVKNESPSATLIIADTSIGEENKEEVEVCRQFLQGKCRRYETCRFYHSIVILPPLRTSQCAYVIGGRRRCQSNAADIDTNTGIETGSPSVTEPPTAPLTQPAQLCSLHTELGLEEQRRTSANPKSSTRVSGSMGRVSNPLSVRVVAQPILPSQFKDPTLPYIIDIGSARGLWLLRMAALDHDHAHVQTTCSPADWAGKKRYNYVGFETRGVLVDAAQQASNEKGLGNCLHFLQGNAATNIEGALSQLQQQQIIPQANPVGITTKDDTVTPTTFKPGITIAHITVHFPDPWSKASHVKRRIVDINFLDTCAKLTKPGGYFHVCSNRLDVVQAAYDTIIQVFDYWTPLGFAVDKETRLWMTSRQFPFGTERDEVAEKQQQKVHRIKFVRNDTPYR